MLAMFGTVVAAPPSEESIFEFTKVYDSSDDLEDDAWETHGF
jgi:hypothetical protein